VTERKKKRKRNTRKSGDQGKKQKMRFCLFCLPLLALVALSSFSLIPGCNGKIVDFDKHYKAWAQKKAQSVGRSLSWTDAYGKQKHLAERPEYSKYKVEVEYENVRYQNAVKDVARPGFTFEEWYHNGGSAPLTGRFSKTKSVTAAFTWSVTEGLKIGTENTFKAGLPGVVGGDLKFKTELELSSTQAKTTTEKETFTVENHIPVAPKTSVKAVFTVIEREVQVPWTADVWVNGYIACWFEPKWEGHWLWFFPVNRLANQDFKLAGNRLRFPAKGVFKGIRGVETVLTTEECDYDTFQNTGECVSKFGLRSGPKVIERKIWHPSV